MELNGCWICAAAAFLAYLCVFACQCYRKTKRAEAVTLFVLIPSAAPFLLENHFALTIFYAAFSLSLLVYFEFYYERRLSDLGRTANDIKDISPQCKLLPFFADKISEKILKSDFHIYSPDYGTVSLMVLAKKGDSPVTSKHLNFIFQQSLQFIYSDIAEKWGVPSRGHSVILLVEQINRNAFLYLKTANAGNMADIHDAARQNLKSLFSLYYSDFYLKKPEETKWKSPEAFAELLRNFEKSLVKFPLRLELA